MCLEVFVEGSPKHVLEMAALEDHIEEVVVLDVLDPACVYTFICLEIKTNTETVALGILEKVQRTLGSQVRFFLFLWWKESFEGAAGPIFSNLQFFTDLIN
jgi:hypothetical protein